MPSPTFPVYFTGIPPPPVLPCFILSQNYPTNSLTPLFAPKQEDRGGKRSKTKKKHAYKTSSRPTQAHA